MTRIYHPRGNFYDPITEERYDICFTDLLTDPSLPPSSFPHPKILEKSEMALFHTWYNGHGRESIFRSYGAMEVFGPYQEYLVNTNW